MSALSLLQNWGKLGVGFRPTKITHDGGPEFKARFEDMCAVLKLHRHVSMHDRPAGHGLIERFNRDLALSADGQTLPIRSPRLQVGVDTSDGC